jgi:CO/xanthine dehydrogenase FAD-binding subunit
MSLYLRPRTVQDAVRMLAGHEGTILAGATDFFPALGDRQPTGTVIDISAIAEMQGIDTTADDIRIGGLTTWSELVASPLPRCFDALKSAAKEIGGIQIQNRGTLAGNLCNASPAADGVPPLLALDADVELASAAGTRLVPLASFLVGNRKTLRRNDEILTRVVVKRTVDDAASVFLKLGARRYLVISVAMVAAVVRVDDKGRVGDARISVGSCSATAQRLRTLESALLGEPVCPGLGALATPEHLQPLSPIADVRATANYRRDAALTLVSRALEACAGKC